MHALTSSHSYTLRLGIDGGGSGSRYVLYAPESGGREVRRFEGPPLQLRSLGADAATERIISIINTTLAADDINRLSSVSAGIAGGSGQTGKELEIRLQDYFKNARIRVSSDAAACFAAQHHLRENYDGASLLLCGTGSVFMHYEQQQLILRGGYGPASIEYGSGRQLGRDFLSYVSRLYDAGRFRNQRFSWHASFSEAGCAPRSRAGMLDLFYNSGKNPAAFASPCLQLAEAGEPGCKAIVALHLKSLQQLCADTQTSSGALRRIALYGGLFNNDYFRKHLQNAMQEMFPQGYIFHAKRDVAYYLCEYPELPGLV